MSAPASSRPGKFLLIFALAMVGVAAFTVLDARQRTDLETTVPDPALAETALADNDFFPSPGQFAIHDEIVRVADRPYFRLRMTIADKRDEYLVRVGRDDSDRWWVYRETKPEGSKTPPEPNRFFLKTGRRAFVQITDIAPSEG